MSLSQIKAANAIMQLLICNQCNYASSQANDLKKHLKRHRGEKSSKCNQCDCAYAQTGNSKIHLKHTVEKIEKNATIVIMQPQIQGI